jgi:Protein of unknown function (DUF3667)
MIVESACKTCGTTHTTAYCSHCGEKRISTHDYSLAHFAEHAFEVFTHFDFKFFRSLKTVVLHPGRLTKEYLEGRRKPYVGPVQLFVLVNVVFFLVSSIFSVRIFNQSLHNQLERPTTVMGNFLPETKAALVREEISRRGMSFEDFEKEFNAESNAHAKSLVFVIIPAFALAVAVFCGSRKRYMFEHLIFATNAVTFWLVLMMALIPLVIVLYYAIRLTGMTPAFLTSDGVIALILGLAFALYLFVACRRVYGGGLPVNILRAVLLSYSMVPILQAYRVFLFYTAIHSM